ncbi:hypothetical protein RRG08_062278 [Elysia crispata]|uniref:Uncharacterized protein n=1 Tax=Elysia crispata TaxID=231223 RepID=A0AAE0YGA3_9GAST|nr:hypothetical protein RRG08_062278 [Elysia crispata]
MVLLETASGVINHCARELIVTFSTYDGQPYQASAGMGPAIGELCKNNCCLELASSASESNLHLRALARCVLEKGSSD